MTSARQHKDNPDKPADVLNRPGVIVYRRDPKQAPEPFRPAIRVERPIGLWDLLRDDEDHATSR